MNKIIVLLMVAMALIWHIAVTAIAQTFDNVPRDERAAIIERCRERFGGRGSSMVLACAHQDMEAYQMLQAYPPEYAPFIQRCKERFGKRGWNMILACAHQDIEAEEALSRMLDEGQQ